MFLNTERLSYLRAHLRGGRPDLAARTDAELAPLGEITRDSRQAMALVGAALTQRPAWGITRYLQSYQQRAHPGDDPLLGTLRLTLTEVAERRRAIATRWYLLAVLGSAPFHLELATALWEMDEVADNRAERLLEILADWGLVQRRSATFFELPARLRPLALDGRLDLPAFPSKARWQNARLLALDHCLEEAALLGDRAGEDPPEAQAAFRRLWPHLVALVERLGWDEEMTRVLAEIPEGIARPALGGASGVAHELAQAVWAPRTVGSDTGVESSLRRAQALRAQGQHRAALAHLDDALAAFRITGSLPGTITTLAEMGDTLMVLGDFRAALKPLEEAVALQREAPANLALLVRLLAALGHAAEGVDEVERALEAWEEAQSYLPTLDDPQLHAEVETGLGRAYLERGAWRRALSHLTSALALVPYGSKRYTEVARLIVRVAEQRGESSDADEAALDAAVRWLAIFKDDLLDETLIEEGWRSASDE